MALKETSKKIFLAIREADKKGELATNQDIAEATGLTAKQVVGSMNSLVKKNYAYREEKNVQQADGTTKAVKFLHVTEDGMNLDPDAENA